MAETSRLRRIRPVGVAPAQLGGWPRCWDHVQHWTAPRDLMRCPTSGCLAHIAFGPTCLECHCATVPLWEG